MKRLMAAAVLALGAAQAQAAPCISGTLADYVSLGSCEIGSNTASGFEALTTVPGGSTLVAAANVLVTPVFGSSLGFGFDFGLSLGTAPALFLDFLVGYRVTGNDYVGASLLADGVPSGDGVLTAIADLCLDGAFPAGIGSCTATAAGPLVVAQLAGDPAQMDQLAFGPAGAIAVITDVGIDTGTTGDTSLVSVGNRFAIAPAAVSAPAPLALLLAGLGGLALTRRYALRRNAAAR